MMVERSKLEKVMGEAKGNKATIRAGQPLQNQTSLLKRPNTRSSRSLENCDKDDEGASIKLIDDAGQPDEICLEEEFLEKKGKVDLKRKAAEGDFLSRRLRRRG